MSKEKTRKTKSEKDPDGNKYLLQMTRRGLLLGICLLVLISAWMFVLGVLVGRGTAPVHFDIEVLQKELIALKESIIKQEQERMKADASVEKDRELDFYEALKGSKQEEVPDLKPSRDSQEGTPRKASTERKALTSMKKKTKKAPTPLQQGAFEVQVASTKDADAAERLVEKLKDNGFRAYRERAEVTGKGTWYRVRAAGFASRGDAEKANREISKLGYKGMVLKK
jgi:DedD protein